MRRVIALLLPYGLAIRVALQMLAVVMVSLMLMAYLNYSNFDKTQRQLAQSRILVSSGEVIRAVSSVLELGLSLDEMSNLGEILQNGLQSGRSDGLQNLTILNNDGIAIASTSTDANHWNNINSWPIERQQKVVLRSLATDRFAVGVPLVNAFGSQSGWLIVAYDGTNQLAARKTVREGIFKDFAWSALAATLALVLGAVMVFRKGVIHTTGQDSHAA
ncbi:MAG: hypothetical protein FGM53_01080 [Rhodocyclaceae bacterium]|nr:hypothetical protein [Rhodocyclaceae bacterium]